MAAKQKNFEALTKYFSGVPSGKKALAQRLIDRESFLLGEMLKCEANIRENGVKETYQNGENQFGYKESTEFKCYIAMQKNYIQIIRQLSEILPEEAAEELDEFERIVGL